MWVNKKKAPMPVAGLASFCFTLVLSMFSCSIPGLEDGNFNAVPGVNLFKPKGKAKLTSNEGGRKNPTNNYSSALKLSDRETDPAMTLFYGDGFSGLELGYEQFKREHSKGQLSSDFGRIGSGRSVESYLKYYGYRFAYVGQVWSYDFPSGIPLGANYELTPYFHLGLGAGIHRIKWILAVEDQDGDIEERVKCLSFVPFGTLRFQVDMDTIKFRIDESYSIGDFGEIASPYLDTFITLRWEVAPSVDLLVGMRDLSYRSEGHSRSNKLKATSSFSGWMFGLYVVF